MRKSITLLMIAFFLSLSTSWAKEKGNVAPNIDEFIAELHEIKLPFSTASFSKGLTVSNDFFYYEKDNDYYELDDLRSFGYFELENKIYIVYGFNLNGLGEGGANRMIVLSSFHDTGEHIQDIELGGTIGGEGGAYVYENAIVSKKVITVDVRDEHYSSDTGLSYPVIEYKRYLYGYHKKYSLLEKTFRCKPLKSLEEYYLKLKSGYESKDDSLYGLSYLLENYMHCFPVKKDNLTTYKSIWNYLKRSSDNSSTKNKSVELLLRKIKKLEPRTYLALVSVDNLRLRDAPSLNGKKVELLPMNSEVIYLEEKSSQKQEVIINNRKIVDYWYKVKTKAKNEGWLHGCCLNQL